MRLFKLKVRNCNLIDVFSVKYYLEEKGGMFLQNTGTGAPKYGVVSLKRVSINGV